MNYEINKTVYNRHQAILRHINVVWRLEKDKLKLRENFCEVSNDIKIGLRLSRSFQSVYDAGSLAGTVGANRRNLQKIEKDIGEIREKQIKELDKIRHIIMI